MIIVTLVWSLRIVLRPGLADWDILTQYMASGAFLGEHLRRLDVPGWNPYLFSGASFVGNPQSAWAYLPVMVLFTVLPPVIAFAVSILLHLVGAAIATYALARLLGIGLLGATVAGLAYALSANLGVATCCTIHLEMAPWLPLSLIGVELALRQRSWASQLGALGISAFAFSQIAAAWVGQGTYNAALLLGSFLVWRGIANSGGNATSLARRVRRTLVYGTWVFGLGAGLSAMGMLPRLDVVGRTYVGSASYQGANFAPNQGLDWWRVAEDILRFRLEWFPYHLGGSVVTLALVGAVVSWRRSALVYFVLAAIIIVILPMRPTPLHELFYLLPRFRAIHLHDPARLFAILPLPVSILAGAGVEGVLRPLTRGRSIAAAVLVIGFWSWSAWLAESKSWSLHWITWVAVALAVTACVGIVAAERNHVSSGGPRGVARTAAMMIVVGVLLDPAAYASYRWIAAGDDRDAESAITQSTSRHEDDGAGQYLLEREAAGEVFRYFGFVDPPGLDYQAHEHFADPSVLGLLANNRAFWLGLDDVQGYDPAQLVRYQDVFAAINGFRREYHEALVYADGIQSPLLNLLNVRYVIMPASDRRLDAPPASAGPQSPRYQEVFTNGTVRVYENAAALPRAWIVHETQQVTPAEALSALASGTVDPRTVALMGETPPRLQPATAGDAARISRYETDRVSLEVTAASEGLLVLGDVYDPGWQVFVDGERSRLYPVDTMLRGVSIPTGSHVVEFRYEPRSLWIGIRITLLSLLVLIAVAIAGIRSSRRAGGATSPNRAA